MTAAVRNRKREVKQLPPTLPCKRCARPRQVSPKRNALDYCASCVQIIARENKAKVPHAACLVTLARVERWHMHDRLSRVC